jgi:predicted nucleotidyltransferase component of viral defense system
MDKFYQRNLIKDKIQDYILYFIYNSKDFKNLIFTGGTCLRKLYRLPRLSEDIDLDYQKEFNIDLFGKKIILYFRALKTIPVPKIKITNNKKTIFLKFFAKDFLKEKNLQDNEIIFVRCDFSLINNSFYQTETNPYFFDNFNFFIKSYDLPTLFANKLSAFLERDFFKGNKQKIAFKGRDVFDIFWFLDLSAKSGFNLKPNWLIIKKNFPQLTKEDFIEKIIGKIELINKKDVYLDLAPFISDKVYLEKFIRSFQDFIKRKIIFLN